MKWVRRSKEITFFPTTNLILKYSHRYEWQAFLKLHSWLTTGWVNKNYDEILMRQETFFWVLLVNQKPIFDNIYILVVVIICLSQWYFWFQFRKTFLLTSFFCCLGWIFYAINCQRPMFEQQLYAITICHYCSMNQRSSSCVHFYFKIKSSHDYCFNNFSPVMPKLLNIK